MTDDVRRVLREAEAEERRASLPKMACPKCGDPMSKVIEGRPVEQGYRRVRVCAHCGFKYRTYETAA